MGQFRRVTTSGLLVVAVALAVPLRGAAKTATVVVGITADAVTLDPAQVLSATDRKYAMNIFDGLVEQKLESFTT